MKVVLLCKSDTTGGAAVVTFRLMKALRKQGVDAKMLVAEKNSDSIYVDVAAPRWKIKVAFLAERLRIFLANGFDKSTLFRFDTGADGVSISHHPWVKEADIICLNWVNQGFISFREIAKLAKQGKKLVWTMHDMWNMTGICHHAGDCINYLLPTGECGNCPLLVKKARRNDLSHRVWNKKHAAYISTPIHFVAVSNWLALRARSSSLMSRITWDHLSVIPNAFPIQPANNSTSSDSTQAVDKTAVKIVFGAARLDDEVKDFPVFIRATQILAQKYPETARKIEIITFGNIRQPDLLEQIPLKITHLGRISPDEIKGVYESAQIVVSTSRWETLPGTLIEGQAWGCIPVALNHGGQPDIIDHLSTGYLAQWDQEAGKRASAIAEGILWASTLTPDERSATIERMQKSVRDRFSEEAIADQYISLFKTL